MPGTHLKINGLSFFAMAAPLVIFFQKRLIRQSPDIKILPLAGYSTLVTGIAELIFQAIRQIAETDDTFFSKLLYFGRSTIVSILLWMVFGFWFACELRKGNAFWVRILPGIILLLFYLLNKFVFHLPN